jgi:ankyrin repeat protein
MDERIRDRKEKKRLEGGGLPELQPTELYMAVSQHNSNEVLNLLAKGHAVDERSSAGNTPLIEAAKFGYVDIIHILIDHDADTNARNDYGENALHFAANRHHLGAATALIDSGVELSVENRKGNTALDWVLHDFGHLPHEWTQMFDMATLLVRAGADVNAGHGVRETPFMWLSVMGRGRYERVEQYNTVPPQFDLLVLMIKYGANINATGYCDYTLLHTAALGGDIDLALWLIMLGADFNIPNDDGQTLFDTLTSPIPQGEFMHDGTEGWVMQQRRVWCQYHEIILPILQNVRDAMYDMPRTMSILMAATPRGCKSQFHSLPAELIQNILGCPSTGPAFNRAIWDLTLVRLNAASAVTPAAWPVIDHPMHR